MHLLEYRSAHKNGKSNRFKPPRRNERKFTSAVFNFHFILLNRTVWFAKAAQPRRKEIGDNRRVLILAITNNKYEIICVEAGSQFGDATRAGRE
jgi:hypothetical protein